MTDPVEAIAKEIETYLVYPGDSERAARAALAALEKEGFKVFRITMREPEPWTFDYDEGIDQI